MKEFNRDDVEKFILGSQVFGAGGGGDPIEGKQFLLEAVERGVSIIDINELAEDDILISGFKIGALIKGNENWIDILAESTKELKESFGITPKAIIAGELGPGNTSLAIALASKLGIPVVNEDLAEGRSVPELPLNIFSIINKLPVPCVLSNGDNSVIVKKVKDIKELEMFARSASVLGGIGFIGYSCKVKEVRKFLSVKSISESIKLGNCIIDSLQQNQDVARNIVGISGGKELIRGEITDVRHDEMKGFTAGHFIVDNGDDAVKVWFKNENILAWKNDNIEITVPDIIATIDLDGNRPLFNSELNIGKRVAILSIPSSRVWRSNEGLKLLNPRYFGFDLECKLL